MNSSQPSDRPSQPAPGSGFFTWLRGLGLTRSTDRWLTGVAGGIATKAGIDPIIVRGIFVVLAVLGGPGILLYAIGWLLLPDADGRIVSEEIVRGRASAGTLTWAIVLAALVIVPAVLGIGGLAAGSGAFSIWGWDLWAGIGFPGWISATVSTLFWIAAIGGILYWVFAVLPQRRPAGDQQKPAETTDWVDTTADRAAEWGQRAGEQAAAWGERVGEEAARRSEEWSARVAEQHQARQLGPGHTVLTIAAMLLAAGATALVMLQGPVDLSISSVAPAPFIGGLIAALAVIACSLIIAGVRGRHTGWVGFFAWCGVIALFITVFLPWGTKFQAFGDTRVTAVEAPGLVTLAGTVDVDLTSLDRYASNDTWVGSTTPNDQADLAVWIAAGTVNVELPDSHPTLVVVRVLAGNISVGPQRSGLGDATELTQGRSRMAGPFLSRTVRSNITPDTKAADISTVEITLAAGNVRVNGVTTSRALEMSR